MCRPTWKVDPFRARLWTAPGFQRMTSVFNGNVRMRVGKHTPKQMIILSYCCGLYVSVSKTCVLSL